MFEAMAMGVPLLMAAPAGEASRILERDAAGVRVSSESPSALAEETRRWMNHPEIVSRYADSSLAAASGYSRQRQAEALIEILQAASRGRGAAVSSMSTG
jgi:putative colanic acid biosynthesis glycosyltransferase WcaI